MMVWAWLACGGAGTPPSAPDPARLRVEGDQLVLDGAPVMAWKALEEDPTDEVQPALSAALRAAPGDRPLFPELPGDTPFWKLRKVVGSAREAEREVGGLKVAGAPGTVQWHAPARYGLAGTCDAPVAVKGSEPLVTLSVQNGPDGAWVVATATFLPVTERGPVDGFGPECLEVPPCDTLFPEGATREACRKGEAEGGERRVELGGEHGCLLPIARQPEQVAAWGGELGDVAVRLGLPDRPLVVVMPEARTRMDALVAVMGGLQGVGMAAPVGSTMLVEGNDGPPVCTATVRDRAAFDAAGARWLGSLRRAPPQE